MKGLRNVNLLYSTLATTQLLSNASINRLMNIVNVYNIDLFVNMFSEFKKM